MGWVFSGNFTSLRHRLNSTDNAGKVAFISKHQMKAGKGQLQPGGPELQLQLQLQLQLPLFVVEDKIHVTTGRAFFLS